LAGVPDLVARGFLGKGDAAALLQLFECGDGDAEVGGGLPCVQVVGLGLVPRGDGVGDGGEGGVV
jgi:hypothetical protein